MVLNRSNSRGGANSINQIAHVRVCFVCVAVDAVIHVVLFAVVIMARSAGRFLGSVG